MKSITLALSLVLLMLNAPSCSKPPQNKPKPQLPMSESQEASAPAPSNGDIRIIMKTSRGDMHITLFASKVPLTCANFLNLATHGYYDSLTFHRVIPGFMIQGGDPEGSGRGGPGYRFEDEFDTSLRHSKAGILSMANAGPGTNGSQFFITHGPQPHLDNKHSVFGEVTAGLDITQAIAKGDTINSIEILDSTDALFAQEASKIASWNAVLKQRGLIQ